MIWVDFATQHLRAFAYSFEVFAAGLFGFPAWNEYLSDSTIPGDEGSPAITSIYDFWLIGAAVFEMILYGAGLIAVGYFIYSGFIFMTSQGNPERVAMGRKGLINAVVGLIITMVAANIVGLVAGLL